MKQSTKQECQKTILQYIEFIAENAKESSLSSDFFTKAKSEIEIVSGYLKCTEIQAVFFSIIFEINLSNPYVDIAQLGIHLSILPIKVATYSNELESLFSKRLINKEIKQTRKQTLLNINYYSVNRSLMESILANNDFSPESENITDAFDFFKYLEKLFIDVTLTGKLIEISKNALNLNSHLPMVNQIKLLKLDDYSLILFLTLCIASIEEDGELAINYIVPQLYDVKKVQLRVKAELKATTHRLLVDELVYLGEEEFISEITVGLSEKGKSLVFGDDFFIVKKINPQNSIQDLILASGIKSKKLFFNSEMQKKLAVLNDILHPDKYTRLVQRLEDANMSKGFAILFYGHSGTGKTEAVYQLAKQTNRNIKMVNISATKSKWFGESEKLIKKVFDDYKKLEKSFDVKPILLFNEADAIFGLRGKIGRNNVDQTQNAIQNIILQELENFTGILIATTNLNENFDTAFDRRFLYKIKFETPSIESKTQIWRDKITSIKTHQALKLSQSYDLSGGQIDNISKKYLLNQILYGKKPSIIEVEKFCQEETLNRNNNSSPIGFRISSQNK